MKRKKAIKIGVVALLCVLAVGIGLFFFTRGDKQPKYRWSKITRGDITATVTATGTMNAVVTVLVGTQVSGTIKALFVDYNSSVKRGQILAQIDPAIFTAQVEQARANLLQAKANVEKADAALIDAKRIFERNKTLFAKDFIARSDLETSEANYQSAVAQVSAAKAQVAQARAALDYAETNLRYTRIISPVDGTVISRNVDVGQTVAASFQTPTLFNIAQDLKKMQIDTNVDEADIGKIKVDQPVTFTVDAYPNMTFQGKVAVVRNAPITVQNVVTYDVVVQVDNSDLRLKPGMTANVTIVYAEKKGVLKVPNAALRFRFSEKDRAADAKGGAAVWGLDENRKPKRYKLQTGVTDGTDTELVAGDLQEGGSVIVGLAANDKKAAPQQQQQPPLRIR
jgi:HlyD family secretion protein